MRYLTPDSLDCSGLFGSSLVSENKAIFIGDLSEKHHDVHGSVYALNATTLLVKNFTHDGEAPDVFFWAGTSGSVSGEGRLITYPFLGTHYSDSADAPKLGRYTGQDLVLHLPPPLTVAEVKWLSVWCRLFGINFGELYWPDNFNEAQAVGESGIFDCLK